MDAAAPRISVVIPTYNRRALLARTLPTVFAQNLPAGDYEVIVVVEGVLDCFCQPWAFRAARDKLVASLVPGGYLLAGNPRNTTITEGAWWGRYLIRGGKWIDACLSEHPRLSVEYTSWEPTYVDTLFRKRT